MAEAPYQRDWRPIGARHGLRISHATSGPDPADRDASGPGALVVAFTVLTDDGRLVLRHEVPRVLAADWVAALISLLDVPAGSLPAPGDWGAQADELARLRRDLQALPGASDPRG